MSKIHYPRFNAHRSLCNWNIQIDTSNITAHQKLFFKANKESRCATCEKRLRNTGFDLNKWIAIEGGTL